jgi:hypothetical protein
VGGDARGGGFSIAESASIARDNIADAVASVAGRFWSEDVGRIGAILQRRVRQLLPYLRRLVAHAAAFWGGVTYLRRALAAFVRVLNSDARVRELLRRIGWGSATTLRVALALAKVVIENLIRGYELMRDTVIPGAQVLLPRAYSRLMYTALRTARNSPWAMVLGPASITLALHAARLPDPMWLHRKFGVNIRPKDQTPFGALGWGGWSIGGGRSGGADDDGGDRATSLSYTYTYGTGTSRADETEPRGEGTVADTAEYYYTYGSGTHGGGDRGLSSVGGGASERRPLSVANRQGGRGVVPARTKSSDRRARGDEENDRRRSQVEDNAEYGAYGDGEYDY